MLKTLGLTTLAMFSAATAYAGAVANVAPVSPVMVEEEVGSMGGSGLWLIPLLLIALVVLGTKSSDSDPQSSSPPR